MRRFTLDPGLSLPRIAETLPFTFTGADLYALCSDAMLKAVTRSARLVDSRLAQLNEGRQHRLTVANFFDHHATDADLEVAVAEEDFLDAKKELVPSVSLDELRHYEQVRDSFEGAARKKDDPAPVEQRPQQPVQAAKENRPKLSEVMKRANGSNASMGRTPTINGSGKRFANAQPAVDGAEGSDADDDDYVVRTDKLNLNGTGVPSRPVMSRGTSKGKGKGRDIGGQNFEQGEDLYD